MRFLALFCLCTLAAFGADNIVRIGFVLPITGDNAYLGESFQRAVELSYNDLPEDVRSRYEIFFDDDEGKIRNTLLAARRLIDNKKVDVISGFAPAATKVIAPLAKQRDIINFDVSLGHEFADAKHNFTFWGLPKEGADMIIKRLIRENKKRVAIFYAKNDPGVRQSNAFAKAATQNGLEIVIKESFNPGDRDFRMSLSKVNAANPDIIYLFGWMPEIDIILRQKHQMSIDTPVTTAEAFNFVVDRSLLEGVWYATAMHGDREFLRRMKESYGLHGDFAEPGFYDVLQIVVDICEQYPDRKPTREEIAEGLLNIKDYKGAAGVLTMQPTGQILIPHHIVRVVNGEHIKEE